MFKKFEKKDYKYLLYFLYVPIYAIWFTLVEKHITTDYYVSYMRIDDFIPFNEYFYIFYFSWYFFLAGIVLFTLFTDRQDFSKLMQFIIISITLALIFFIVFPNGQDLRPTTFERDNIFTRSIQNLYQIDTNTNVLPSMHVVGTIAGTAAIFHSRALRKRNIVKAISFVLCVLICLSTVFVKQHSFLDVIVGVIWCVPFYLFYYTKLGEKLFKRKTTAAKEDTSGIEKGIEAIKAFTFDSQNDEKEKADDKVI